MDNIPKNMKPHTSQCDIMRWTVEPGGVLSVHSARTAVRTPKGEVNWYSAVWFRHHDTKWYSG